LRQLRGLMRSRVVRVLRARRLVVRERGVVYQQVSVACDVDRITAWACVPRVDDTTARPRWTDQLLRRDHATIDLDTLPAVQLAEHRTFRYAQRTRAVRIEAA